MKGDRYRDDDLCGLVYAGLACVVFWIVVIATIVKACCP